MEAYTTRVIPPRSAVYPPRNINLSPLIKSLSTSLNRCKIARCLGENFRYCGYGKIPVTYGNICIVETWSVYTYRVIALPGGERENRPGGLRVHPEPSISQTLAPARLASVCGRVECLPRGFSCLNPFRSA